MALGCQKAKVLSVEKRSAAVRGPALATPEVPEGPRKGTVYYALLSTGVDARIEVRSTAANPRGGRKERVERRKMKEDLILCVW